ncbi:MAG: hypothetical protein ACREDS_01425 [Limisphaerales bacterium]
MKAKVIKPKLNMKKNLLKTILLITATIISSLFASAQPTMVNQPETVWGAVSNGVCAGAFIEQSNWGSSYKDDFYCCMELKNMTTNLLWGWFPPLEQRYEIQLLGPDGKQVRQLKPFSSGLHTQWSGLSPFSTNSTSCSLDWFFLKNTFDIRTNGQFTLIASVRVNVFTNFIAGQYQMQRNPIDILMRGKPTYFLLPPVTNTFDILPQELSPHGQTNSVGK